MVSPVALHTDHAAALRSRLDDPAVAEALNTLLDHADLLAVMVTGLDGILSRGDTITDSLADGITELRTAGSVDSSQLVDTARRLSALAPALRERLPLLEALLTSDALADPQLVDLLGAASKAFVRGTQDAKRSDASVKGVVALVKALKDDDVGRTLGFLFSVARAFGQELNR